MGSLNQHFRYIFFFAFLLRIALPIASWTLNDGPQRFYQPDTSTYLRPATEWLNTGQFTTNNSPELLRPPGYPFFLLPGIITKWIIPLTIAFQIGLSLVTLHFTLCLTTLITQNPNVKRSVGYLAAIEPISIIYTSQLLTETLFTTLVTAGLYTLLQAQISHRKIVIAALLFAGATYTRPIGYYLPIALLIPLIYTRYPIKSLAFFILISMGLPGLWQVRNYNVAHYTSFSAISSINLYFYQAASVKAKINHISFNDQQNQQGYRNENIYLSEHPNQQNWSLAQRYKYMADEGIETVIEHPFTYAKIHIKGMIRTLFDPGAIDLLKMLNAYPQRGNLLSKIIDEGLLKTLWFLFYNHPFIFIFNLVLGLLLLFYYGLSISAFRAKAYSDKRVLIFCLITCAYFILLAGGPQSLNRFRHPIMPFVVISAGLGWAGQRNKTRPQRSETNK